MQAAASPTGAELIGCHAPGTTSYYENESRNRIISVKKITTTDVSYVVERIDWVSGTVYDMFEDASSFNQDLCLWGDNYIFNPEYTGFQYNVDNNMFEGSGCTYQATPQEVNPDTGTYGPFCASDCTAR